MCVCVCVCVCVSFCSEKLMFDCIDEKNLAWSSKWEAFRDEKPPSPAAIRLCADAVTVEALHCLTAGCNVYLTELLVFVDRVGGKEALKDLQKLLSDNKQAARWSQQIQTYLRSGKKELLTCSFPR